MSEPSVWTCPGCGRKFRLPVGKKPPRQCQTCQQATDPPAPVIDESSFLADLAAAAPRPAPPPAPAPPPVDPGPVFARTLPTSFVKVIELPEPKSLAFRIGKFVRRQGLVAAVLAAIGLIGASVVGAMMMSSIIHGWSPAPKEEPAAFKPLTDDQVFWLATREVRDRLKAQKTAEFSNEYQFKPIRTQPGEPEKAWISGEVDAQNAFGTFIHSEWTMSISIDREAWTIVPSVIMLDDKIIYQDELTAEAIRGFERATGNEMSGLSAEVQREIDRVEAAANEAIAKAVRTKTFLLQSPNDPDRHHLNINLDVTKTWRISGKIDFFDGAPPREVYGHFDPDSNSCIRLRIGKKWHVGGPPPDVNGFPVN